MLIVETSTFSRKIDSLLDRDSYRLLQLELAENPEKGDLIPGTGGLRKIRWAVAGRGKRGGVRVICYWARSPEVLLMLFAYGKNERVDLTSDQKKLLRGVVKEEFG